ncbi:MAG: ABC transporter ATP-binding protein [Brevibacterium sp.]|nr:ABC transporter ATP-binding protein [Brevibacterium sp.]MDN5834124.1 ABC transporter ATP-binding protein [Brevibacterium sp.]MDN5907989.1 ABC transporter ATP-binding protein [Brevibacterium sp.]MDN6132959.1 ABC transporter ATP-binding protein [Brevibacterium sp.]MDN6173791.1 ABC transporter ATP-binding protein [Brevibacterium sp.]
MTETLSTNQSHPPAEAPILEVRDLTVTFPNHKGDVKAVRGVDYEVMPGEFLGIVGESGSGKSVSSMAVMGLLPSNARIDGSIKYRGRSLLDMDDHEMSKLRGSEIAMVFQDPLSALTPVYTIGEQISEGLLLHDATMSKEAAHERAIELLRIVGIPGPERRVRAYPHEFSGGMRQRAMIAIAIANDPDLIIADEPTTALDVTIQAQILDVLQKAREITGAAIVLITHDLGVVAGHADRIAVMYAGRLVETGPVEQVFARPQMPYTTGLLRSVPNLATAGTQRLVPLEGKPPSLSNMVPGCPFAPRCPIAIDTCREVEPELIGHGTPGVAAACHRADEIASGELTAGSIFPRPEPVQKRVKNGDADRVLEVTGLQKHFPLLKGAVFKRQIGTVRAVDGIDLEIREGQTLGLVGESGCGKSTTIGEVLEMVAPQKGKIVINGVDVSELSKRDRLAMRKDVQVVFQDPMAAIDPRLPVGEVIAEPLTVHKVPARKRNDTVAEMLELVGLDANMADRYPHEFSGGQRQRIGIARALVTNPKLLVLDEPVSALDVSVQAGVINLLEDLRDSLGLSYLFVAHDLAVVRQIADHVAVMYLGRIVEFGASEDLYDNPQHPYTRALMSAIPVPDPAVEKSRERVLLSGDLPSPTDEITGCSFRTRCPLFALLPETDQDRCARDDPQPRRAESNLVACHFSERIHELEHSS